jgi:hypothetical protein
MRSLRLHLLRLPQALGIGALLAASFVSAQDSTLHFGTQIPPEVQTIYEKGLAWLAASQTPEGTWNAGQTGPGVTGICLMAFLASGEDPNFGKYSATVRKSLRSILNAQDAKTGYIPDSMYHHGFAMLALSEAYGMVDESWLQENGKPVRSLAEALSLAVRASATSQKKNRSGGWRYSPDSTDADTSVTGAMLMGLMAARNAGIEVPDEMLQTGMNYIRRSTAGDGSVMYSGGLDMNGSMNLSAIGTLVGAVSKSKQTDEYKAALQRILENLEHRERTYPEYFGYYMAQALFQGDYTSWQKWNAAKVRELSANQKADGSFGGQFGAPYATGMSLLALALNYRFLPIYER